MDEQRRRRYEAAYARDPSEAERAMERDVFGTNEGIWSYTTPAQADMLAGELKLGPDSMVLDVGSGRGWPSVYLARTTGCTVVATDVPAGSASSSEQRAIRSAVTSHYASLRASGTHLPFRERSFDSVIHTDVL